MPDITARSDSNTAPSVVPARVAFLTNTLLQHDVAAFEALRPLVKQLRIFLSGTTEPDRKESVSWGGLDVVVQRSLRWTRGFINEHGYRDVTHMRVPYDTLFQLARYGPDVILSNQFGVRTLFAVLFCMLRPRTKLIVWATLSQRTAGPRGGLKTLIRKTILRRADACFVHGEDGEQYIRSLGYDGLIVRTPYVSDPSRYCGSTLVREDAPLCILFTGQLIERKGVLPFTEALYAWCRKHPDRSVLYRIGGEGPERERLQRLEAPVNLQVEFLGHLNAEQSVVAYRHASVYAFPTLADEWGMVVNEALCMGLPVLASKYAHASLELIHDGSNGWIFDPEDAEDMAASLDRVFQTDPLTLQQMSANARGSVANWTPQRMAEIRAEAIHSVTSRR